FEIRRAVRERLERHLHTRRSARVAILGHHHRGGEFVRLNKCLAHRVTSTPRIVLRTARSTFILRSTALRHYPTHRHHPNHPRGSPTIPCPDSTGRCGLSCAPRSTREELHECDLRTPPTNPIPKRCHRPTTSSPHPTDRRRCRWANRNAQTAT